jgi:hypothetical protein
MLNKEICKKCCAKNEFQQYITIYKNAKQAFAPEVFDDWLEGCKINCPERLFDVYWEQELVLCNKENIMIKSTKDHIPASCVYVTEQAVMQN